MNTSISAGVKLASEVENIVKDELNDDVDVILIPPFTHLASIDKVISKDSKVSLGAQNCYFEKSGAYTGEISLEMLTSAGVKYVVIGHSERREYFNESHEDLASKVNAILEAGLTPIFCCGEKLEVREFGGHFDLVAKQIEDSLFHLSADDVSKVVIAYEPVWAIGTGVTATNDQAQEMHAHIRSQLSDKYGSEVAGQLSILYGGSVKASNAADLFACPDVDGGLVGGASLDARGFVEIAKSF